MTTIPDIRRAHIDSVVAAIREWQRGNWDWHIAMQHADVTTEGRKILAKIAAHERGDIRGICQLAVDAGY